jgi:tripartite ATP-independent transporter DctM subunit
VVLGPIARAADAVPQLVVLAVGAAGGDADARDELWRTKIDLLRGQKPTSEKLFIAGAVPGALLVLAIALYSMFLAWRRKVAAEPVVGRDIWYAVKTAVWEIPIPFIIVVGIFGGFFTAQEAAGVTAAYVVLIEVLVYRDLTWRQLAKVVRESMVLVGAVMLILLTALALKDYLVLADIPATLRDLMTAHVSDPLTFLLLLNVFLLVVGCLMDIFSAIMVVVPLIVPLAVAYGIDPVHLGVIFLVNLEIGYSTPPVGINLFIASLRFDRPMLKLYAACLPFLAIMLVGLAVITYWPDLSLWLVRLTGVD